MAKGSVRRKGKKWYYRFYVEDASGNRIQKEFPGTESKSETESLLRKAMEDYETKMFLAEAKNLTLGDMLDMWVDEDLKPGSLSNGTVMAYQSTVSRIKQHPIGKRKLKTVTADHLQAYMDLLSFGGTNPDGTPAKALSVGYIRLYSAVLQNSFRFAVFPKRLITFNPMQYVVRRSKGDDYDLFEGGADQEGAIPTITHEQYQSLTDFLRACLISSDEDGNEGESKNLSRNNEFTLTIFPKPAEFIQPAEKALYHPTTRQHNKSV